jgi:hypothetical protein
VTKKVVGVFVRFRAPFHLAQLNSVCDHITQCGNKTSFSEIYGVSYGFGFF